MYEDIINKLELTSEELFKSVTDLSETQLKYKVNPQVWSIHECLEHIVITEIGVFRMLSQHDPNLSAEGATEKLGQEKIERTLKDRSKKTEAPDSVKPIGRFSTFKELTDKFSSNRERIIEALKNNAIVFDSRIIVHPVLGELTKMDWLHFLIHHTERHCRQIEEIKSIVQLQMI